jgi:hypothetical protein
MEQKEKLHIGFQRSIYKLDFDFKVHFFFYNSEIYSVTEKHFRKMFPEDDEEDEFEGKTLHGIFIPKRKKQESGFGYLIIDSTFDLNAYDSLNQGAARVRPNICIIHGILSFLANEVFIPAQSFASRSNIVTKHISGDNKKSIAKLLGFNLSSDLKKILQTIEDANKEMQILFFTVFERWRKALYLEKESEESDIFIDESVLAYMHVLEVLSDEFEEDLKIENNIKREQLSEEIIKTVQDNRPNSEVLKMLNRFDNLRIGLKAKILQLLISFSIDSPKAQAIVSRFVEHRNAIAHGRKNLYQEKLVFPLPQFFSFIKDIDEDVELIKILSARCISGLFNIDLWKDEWEYKLTVETTPWEFVKSFMDAKVYNDISEELFLRGKINDITPWTLSFYYKKNKIKFQILEMSLKEIIFSLSKNEQDYKILFESAVILSDSKIKPLAEKCKGIVQVVYDERWFYHSNIRDVIKDYEYHNKELIWFATWLSNKGKAQ